MAAAELDLYQHDRMLYDRRAVCKDLEPNFARVFQLMREQRTALTEDGQIIWQIGDLNLTLAGLYTAEVRWSEEARRLEDIPEEAAPFQAVVLVKNPGRLDIPFSDATTGVTNGLVMVGDTLWCAAMDDKRSPRFELIRRVTDLTGHGRNFQGQLGEDFRQLVDGYAFQLRPWNPPARGNW